MSVMRPPWASAQQAADSPQLHGEGAIIRAVGVRKSYRQGALEVPALRGVDLEIRRGEMVAIMGPSGCGKTTLLNCLSGLDDVSAGQVFVAGRDVQRLDDDARTTFRARYMGFIFQSYNLLPVLSAVENVELPLLVSGTPVRDARERALRALEDVGLQGREHHKPTELSGGQQQRVTIARSLVNDPAIVWADEPTGNLDTKTGLEVLGIMHRLNRERGQTYVIVTHDPALASTCHRIFHMESGQMARVEIPAPRE